MRLTQFPRPLSSRLVVTLCTYNERENIGKLVPMILDVLPAADVLVVDDSSPDGTADVVRQMAAADPRVKLLLRTTKAGLGAATLAGFQWAIDHHYDFVLNMDADFSHHPRHLPAPWACMEMADVAVGSRYVPGGGIVGWSPTRHFMSQGINWYSHVLLGAKARDCSGSFRCYRISKLRELDFQKMRPRLCLSGRIPLSVSAGRLPGCRNPDRVRRPCRRPDPKSTCPRSSDRCGISSCWASMEFVIRR